jgi:small subunit ribosomal protein S24e
LIHPSSVNQRRKVLTNEGDQADEKQMYAFADKRRNESTGSSSATTFLVTTTRLDPLTYILFGAHNVDVVERGLECDNWLPIVGDVNILDDIQRLKTFMEASMLRVFEGIAMSRLRKGQALPVRPREEESESESWDEEDSKKDYTLSSQEVEELDYMTKDIVNILTRYNADRIAQSRQQSRAVSPVPGSSQSWIYSRPSGGSVSGYSTPNNFYSRPGTPSRFSRNVRI